MKILIISDINSTGGTRTYLFNLLNFYRKKKCDLVIATETFENVQELLSSEKLTDITLVKLKPRPTWLKVINDYFHLPALVYEYGTLRSILRNISPELLIVTPSSVGLFMTAIAFDIRKILVVHSYPMAKISYFYKILLKYTKNTQILTVSKFSKSNIDKYWMTDTLKLKVSYIYNPAEIKVKLVPARNTILTVGHIESYKDPQTWIDTARHYMKENLNSQFKFVWVGSGSLTEYLKSEIVAHNLQSLCSVLPPTDNIAQHYAKAYLYFQPSLVESQGISVANAQYVGIPCVVSGAGGLPEMVIDNKTGFVCKAGDYTSMSNRIQKLINDKKKYRKFSIKAVDSMKSNTNNNWVCNMTNYHGSIGAYL